MKKVRDNFRLMWTISCMFVLIIPILIGTITGNSNISELKSANAVNNELIVKQFQKEMDYAVENIFRIKSELISNRDIYTVSSISKADAKDYQYELSNIYETLCGYKRSVDNVDGFFIYFDNIDTIVSVEGVFSADEYYKQYFADCGKTKEQWIETLSMETNGYFEKTVKTAGQKESAGMQYYCDLKMLGQVNPPTFSANISEDYLDNIMKSIPVSDNTYTLVVNEDNKILLGNSRSNEIEPQWIESVDLSKETDYFSSKIGNQKVMVDYVSGKYMDWKYIFISNASEFWRRVNIQRAITVVGIIFSVIFGALCIWGVVRKNYSSMKNILTVLKEVVSDSDTKELDVGEYRYIESALLNILENKKKDAEIMERQRNVLRDSFVNRLLSGKIDDLSSVDDTFGNIGLYFGKKDFIVLAVYVEDYSALFRDEDLEDEKRVSMAQFILSNVFGELLNGEYNSYMLVKDDMPVILVNLDFDGHKKDICDIVSFVREFLNKNFDLNIKVGISEPTNFYEGISAAYDEAIETVEYKVLFDNDDIMYYGEIQKNENHKYRYGYSIELEQRLMLVVRSGKEEDAFAVLDQIFDSIQGISDLNIFKCFMFDIGSTMIKIIEENRLQWDDETTKLLLDAQSLLENSSITRMKSRLRDLVSEMCGYFSKRNKSEKLSDQINKYLEEHYSDINLSVAAIGDEFGFVPRYISKIFKDETGEGLLDHINKLRIQKSKKVMENKKLGLEEVAGMVGFTNVNSFIRVFKKYEGMTPGRYREAL